MFSDYRTPTTYAYDRRTRVIKPSLVMSTSKSERFVAIIQKRPCSRNFKKYLSSKPMGEYITNYSTSSKPMDEYN